MEMKKSQRSNRPVPRFPLILPENNHSNMKAEKRKNVAIVLAAGRGTRMGGTTPKQFLDIDGKTVLEHAVAAFEKSDFIDEIAVVTIPGYEAAVSDMAKRDGWRKLRHVLGGGAERTDSSLAAIRAYAGCDANLLFHDAARPFVSQQIIESVCRALEQQEAAVAAVPAVDTIYEISGSCISRIPDRSTLRCAQTPQGFRLHVVEEAYRKAMADPEFRATDDCGVVHRYCPAVAITLVEGEAANKKITYKEDLA